MNDATDDKAWPARKFFGALIPRYLIVRNLYPARLPGYDTELVFLVVISTAYIFLFARFGFM